MAEHMDLYTDCPECESRCYDTDTRICARCNGSGEVPVRVKALEWVDELDTSHCCYGVAAHGADDRWYCSGLNAYFDTRDAAKAAYQQSHERRVMAMLEVV